MNNRLSHVSSSISERRAKPRIDFAYPALVRGHQVSGGKFETQAVLSNMSANGMFLEHLENSIQEGDDLFIVVRLSSSQQAEQDAPQIAAQGRVVRIERQSNGRFGVAVNLHNHRFL